ncbi:hypothetical protein N5D37_19705 [Comamonas aquatica]|jgi:hypothetical protein|uniref:Uncharacterized protein n=1 Tax=Comamonas aquatica TaxID=225991 RepID=A0AA42HV70_9BURK|nr:hypothetical protein [Comamonas aquatica]MDH0364886.1 hypothetical protein [Comamonas aquatica]MDH1606977.1 hypothetical protein [Comamonas aquatica]MDH1618750.1 hypothetical protein [Comamonas aquatica]MDH1767815.1 hypothetical protein [Comamonas aquatica]MDH1902957.1 hypothetical protein [Comamonas aquatica]
MQVAQVQINGTGAASSGPVDMKNYPTSEDDMGAIPLAESGFEDEQPDE